ncbi:MAG: hypothetical protein P0120_06035 [Nitrospira sp.]|nr:hypothetical protein [Nitrospira sp.]
MNPKRFCLVFLYLIALVTVGCASRPVFPESSFTGQVVPVGIGKYLTPQKITAGRFDEVRWVNMSGDPVYIWFVGSLNTGNIFCAKGFGPVALGFVMVARVKENEYASLCFSAPGNYVYTVTRTTAEETQEGGITGTVTIEASRFSRFPDAQSDNVISNELRGSVN